MKAVPTVSADEALEAAESLPAPPNLIVADYHLDSGTGLEAINRLWARYGRNTPAIVASADHSPALAQNLKDQGVAVLWKPLKTDALFAAMAETLGPS